MPFPSLSFLIFGVLFFAGWPVVYRHARLRQIYLIGASLGFYGASDPRMLLIFLPTGLAVFLLALAIERAGRWRRWVFLLALAVVLAELLFFKYGRFVSDNLVSLRHSLSSFVGKAPLDALSPAWKGPSFVPLGLSFYTFQALSTLIEVYRGRQRACRDPLLFLSYFSLFPNVVAGPIARSGELLPQLQAPAVGGEAGRAAGLRLIVFGFFKKVLIADNLVPDIARAFGGAVAAQGALFWWSITVAFAAQIYFDFAGYTDIARGLARWIGLRLPPNFDHPYRARSISGFWSRWHMTLSLWFRDYVFLPLSFALSRRMSGERFLGMKTEVWIYSLASLVTMTLCGFWHGAAWTFLLWGAAHGIFLTVERATRWPRKLGRLPGGGGITIALTLLQVFLAWILFRAESLAQAGQILRQLGTFGSGAEWGLSASASLALAIGVLFELRAVLMPLSVPGQGPSSMIGRILREGTRTRSILEPAVLVLMLLMVMLFRGPGSAFVYFRF